MSMDKTYQPHSIERQWYETWEQRGYFAPSGEGEPYCIVIPPPNVTNSLHMGHGFNNAVMDAMIRYRRMKGQDTLWQMGTDHAGIATQMVVERQLAAEASAGTIWAARPFWEKAGSGKPSPAVRYPSSCAASVHPSTGVASVLPWTRACPARCRKPLCACTKTVLSTGASDW